MKSKITISKRNFLTFLTCCFLTLSIIAQGPSVVSTIPAHNATNVNVTDLITVTFDQPIQAGISGKVLTIWYADTETVYSSFETSALTISGNTLTLNQTLPYTTNLYISLENGLVKNTSDQYNATYGFASNWAFSTEIDTYSPMLTSMSPPDGSVGVYENSNLLSYSFNENVQAGSGNVIVRRVDNDAIILNADVTNPSNVIISGGSFTIVSTTEFDYSTEYYVEFPSGVIEDLLGNPFEGIGSSPLADQNFTMRDAPADTFPPTVNSFSPADNATGVDVNTDFTINFNEDVLIGTGSVFIKTSSGTTIHEIDVSTVSITGSSATFTLPDNLFRLSNYFITIDASAFTDLVGNAYAGISTNIAWNFTTANASDVNPPVAATLTPANNTTDASISADLTLVFNEAVQLFEDAVLKNFGGSVIPSTSSVSGNTLTINPTSDLVNNTQYYVETAYGAIRDLAGNSFTGFSGNTDWNFTTVNSDVISPSPVIFSPLDNATGVSVSNNITITFDEDVQLNGGSPILRDFNTNAEVGSFSFIFSGKNLIINPDADLNNNTQYYVEIANGVIQDIAGNNYAGFSGNTSWNFTTINSDVTSPSPVTFSPIDNATDASISNNLVITFDEDIQVSGGRAILRNFITNVEIGSSSSASGNQLIVNPTSDLSENTLYYVELGSGIVKDLAGNGYAGFSGNSTWNFTTTADATPPSTMTFTPASGATSVSVSDDLTLVFSENIQISGGRAVLRDFNTNVEIGSSSSVIGNRLFINPTNDLNPNTQYYVEIGNGIIQDIIGNGYAGFSGNTTWSFTTGNVLATADFDLKQHLSIYPNPTNGILNIRIADLNEGLTVEIFDILGKKLNTKAFTENNNQIDISDLPVGMYMLKATSSNSSYTTRIIKK